jgi:hypothetical protein
VSYLLQIDNTAHEAERELPPEQADAGTGGPQDGGERDAASGQDASGEAHGGHDAQGGCGVSGRSLDSRAARTTLGGAAIALALLGARRRTKRTKQDRPRTGLTASPCTPPPRAKTARCSAW